MKTQKQVKDSLPEQGKYLIMTKSRKFEGEFCFLVDRNRTKAQWWTSMVESAMIFEKLSAAEWSLNNYQHNEPTIVTLHEALTIAKSANKKSIKTIASPAKRLSWMERRLAYLNYMIDNHDVCWEHGSNYN